MLDRVKLELLKQAVKRDDWIAASDLCLELSLAAKGTTAEFYTDALESAIRLREPKWLDTVIDELARAE